MFVIRNKVKLKVPAGWHEVPWKVGFELFKNPNHSDVEIMSMLTGVSENEIRSVNDKGVISKLLNTFLFLQCPPSRENVELPKVVKIKDEFYHLPFVVYNDPYDLGNATIGAVEDIKVAFSSAIKDIEEPRMIDYMSAYPTVCAIFLQTIKGYDYDKAMKLVSDCEELDFKTVYNMGNFFLNRLQSLRSGYQIKLYLANTIRKKLWRAYWILTQRLASMLP